MRQASALRDVQSDIGGMRSAISEDTSDEQSSAEFGQPPMRPRSEGDVILYGVSLMLGFSMFPNGVR